MSNLIKINENGKEATAIFEGTEVRVVIVDGRFWFCLRDLFKAMKSKTRPAPAKQSVIDTFGDGELNQLPIQTAGGIQKITFVSDVGMTYVVAQGRTKTSKALNRFIHMEVLPSIRKTGQFKKAEKVEEKASPESNEYLETLLTIKDIRIKYLKKQNEIEKMKNEIHSEEKAELEKIASRKVARPAGTTIKNPDGQLFTIQKVAEFIRVHRNNVFERLRNEGILYKKGTENLPNHEYIVDGYFKVKDKIFNDRNGEVKFYKQTLATKKGVDLIMSLFRRQR